MLIEEKVFHTSVAIGECAYEGADCLDNTSDYNGRFTPIVVREEWPI